jgi:hypothetical protein
MNYQEMLDEIALLEAWLSQKGIQLQNNRLRQYAADLEKLNTPEIRENLLGHFTPAELRQLFFTFTELYEFRTIFAAIRERNDPELIRRFVETLNGPTSAAAEKTKNSSNRPRDLQFELLLMSHLSGAGFPILDGGLTDVKLSFQGREIYIECKRPQTVDGIHAAIKGAVKQLNRRISGQSPKPPAIFALSLTKAITEGHRTLNAPDEFSAKEQLRSIVEEILNPHIPYFHRQAQNSIAGILAYASASTIRKPSYSIATVTMQIFFDNPHIPKEEQAFIENWFKEYDRIKTI